jgi:hypothetical protein
MVTGEPNLSDEQWCLLDLLMRARQKGISRLSRMEVLHSPGLPQGVSVKLAWAALTMPSDLMAWHGQHDFSITERGAAIFNFRFGKGTEPAVPTQIADVVICLPGPEHYAQ